MGNNMKKIYAITIVILMVISTFFIATSTAKSSFEQSDPFQTNYTGDDLDPLVDIEITVDIQKIRSLEKHDTQVNRIEKIDWFSDPDFYVKVIINGEEFISDVWKNTKYVYEPNFSPTLNVPDDIEIVNITIQLWDWNIGLDRRCDISTAYSDEGYRDSFDVELQYSLKTGHWTGDDSVSVSSWSSDDSGYGRLNGCDDGSIYQRERDCELWFDITQTDYDGDGIPYWTEVNHYETDPEYDDTGLDMDNDSLPIEWEHKWGHLMWKWHEEPEYQHYWLFDDLNWTDHKNLDPDNDGLDNYEEYLTSQWGSDPFRSDIFVELDRMADSPDGFESNLPEGSKELIRTAFDRQNIIYHIDDGCMSNQDIIPFEEMVDRDRCVEFYEEFFLHGDENNSRRGVFRYGLVVYQADFNGYLIMPDCYQISANGMETKVLPNTQKKRDVVYASAYMHECGHTLGFSPIGGHDLDSYYPWQKGWWKWRPYRSCMNYGYMYKTVDYSDGSQGKNDFDDWRRIDITWFQDEGYQ